MNRPVDVIEGNIVADGPPAPAACRLRLKSFGESSQRSANLRRSYKVPDRKECPKCNDLLDQPTQQHEKRLRSNTKLRHSLAATIPDQRMETWKTNGKAYEAHGRYVH